MQPRFIAFPYKTGTSETESRTGRVSLYSMDILETFRERKRASYYVLNHLCRYIEFEMFRNAVRGLVTSRKQDGRSVFVTCLIL